MIGDGPPAGRRQVIVAMLATLGGFAVHMTEPVAASTPVAWFLLDQEKRDG